MTSTTTSNRIHPLMAAAAVSVTILGLVGAAAIAGLLPNSRGSVQPSEVPPVPAVAAATPLAAAVAPAPMVAAVAPAPAPAPVQHRPRVHHATQVAYQDDYRPRDDRQYQPAPAPQAAAQPNYVGIGAGAVIGGLLGNQVGGGRGKTLATVAGVIGGGMLGNAVQNQVQQPQR
ncbi:glycine zipper 2TM domain-containing protein [Janthinobacterium agaricidamnosum]|uniref:Rickettsia 17 kDa surface antigen family protein n=1 Tax=Janthinobacterium agaricidamnosum NBRC 102515 = DSM 9628 TaxID=1349767 RepID=W0V127_9BURK|nr:glycine zipper 2TM domain-containing protein [Janthinobacterium agaricidamnosum]CDG80977.1 rickettsia 17 kDa surface antigen family protein [Janthinobacterium agaricidamnosum NBRC 102515 = DSM 9628]